MKKIANTKDGSSMLICLSKTGGVASQKAKKYQSIFGCSRISGGGEGGFGVKKGGEKQSDLSKNGVKGGGAMQATTERGRIRGKRSGCSC